MPNMEQEKNWSYVRTGHLKIVSDHIKSCRKCSERHIPVSVSMPCSEVKTACPCAVQTRGFSLELISCEISVSWRQPGSQQRSFYPQGNELEEME